MAELADIYSARITRDPHILVGKPVVKGTRIPVERVLIHLAGTPDLNDLFEAYPRLTIEDVQACFAFAAEGLGNQPASSLARPPEAPSP